MKYLLLVCWNAAKADAQKCGNLNEAVEIAPAHAVAASGMIEVRPFWELG